MCFTFQEYKQAFWLSTRAAVGKVGRINTQLQIEEMYSLSFARFLQRLELATMSRCQARMMFMQRLSNCSGIWSFPDLFFHQCWGVQLCYREEARSKSVVWLRRDRCVLAVGAERKLALRPSALGHSLHINNHCSSSIFKKFLCWFPAGGQISKAILWNSTAVDERLRQPSWVLILSPCVS